MPGAPFQMAGGTVTRDRVGLPKGVWKNARREGTVTIELGLTADRRWEIDLAGMADAASHAGFSSLGLGAEAVDHRAAQELQRRGMRCHEVMALIVSDNAPATLSSAERLASRANILGAPWVVTVFTATMNKDGIALVKRCASVFANAGARMAVEFSPLGSVASIGDGLQVVAAAGPDRAGLLIDTWHFFSGDNTWEDLAEVPLEMIAYIQFDDALPPLSEDQMDETMNRRAMPGHGTFDLERFASTLLARGWSGLVSVEVLSRELAKLPVAEFARLAYTSSARYWL